MLCTPAWADRLELLGSIVLPKGPGFGGFSSLELSQDGTNVLMTTDKGSFVTGEIIRENGVLSGFENMQREFIIGKNAKRLTPFRQDSEGLAIGADGKIYVSFEGWHVVMHFDATDGQGFNLPRNPTMIGLKHNSGMEALAIDAQGTLYAIPERSGNLNRDFPVMRLRDKTWDTKLKISRDSGFLPVGADIGPDGRLYLLERKFHGPWGFTSRVQSFEISEDALIDAQTLLVTERGTHHNLEGISVWTDADGATRVTMVADDNFRDILRSDLVEYRLTP